MNAAQLAVDADQTDPQNWSTLGAVYSILAAAGVEGAADRAKEAFAQARSFDPTNPSYALLEAQLSSRTGDIEGARSSAISAVQLKQNYTDALFFLTQLDIAEGKVEDAIATTRAIISLEPNNPARYYQLGVLESSAGNLTNATAAFTRAVSLDKNYANARYFLALALLQQDKRDEAVEQLRVVLELNPGNEQVTALIGQIESGESFDTAPEVQAQQIEESTTVSEEDGSVTTTESPDTSLIVPVNTVADQPEEDTGTQDTSSEETAN